MKRAVITAAIISLLFSMAIESTAQNNLGKTDDVGRICLNSVIASNSSIPQGANKLMVNKLNQIAAKNGVGGSSINPRFVITANVIEIAQEVVPSAPPMVAMELETTLYIGDAESGVLYGSYSYGSRKCVGSTAEKAYLAGLRNLPVDTPALRSFVEQGKNKIVEYYNSQIDFLLSEAETLASQRRYEESIALLMQVPEVCKDAYTKAMAKASVVYQQKLDNDGAELLTKARAAWKTNATDEGAAEAAIYLGEISPSAACASEANALADSIAKHFKDLEDREWNFKMKKYNDSIEQENRKMDLEEKRIDADAKKAQEDLNAMKEIAMSYVSSRSNVENAILPWW